MRPNPLVVIPRSIGLLLFYQNTTDHWTQSYGQLLRAGGGAALDERG